MSVTELKEREDDRRQIEQAAAEWFARAQSEDLSEARKRELDAWLAADARHRVAYEALDLVWTDMGSSRRLSAMASKVRTGTKTSWFGKLVPQRPAYALLGAAAALTTVAVFFLLPFGEPGGIVAEVHQTQVAEIRDQMLDDGSVVTIGAKSAIEVAFDETQRRVILNEGVAFFSVETDPDRPFFVLAGETVVHVVGTKFDVHRGPEGVEVTVLEGVVEVLEGAARLSGTLEDAGERHLLSAGQKAVSSPAGDVSEVERVSAIETAAWRSGRLVYDNTSLREVIADANRYYDGHIELESGSLGDLRVSASFRSDEIDAMINTLVRGLPVEARRPSPGRIVLREKHDGT